MLGMLRALLAATVLVLAAGPLRASNDDPHMAQACHAAARKAAQRWQVPEEVLHAITLTETGRSLADGFRPWPWTVNMEGRGLWFATPREALDYVARERAGGARSFDVGCFQVNHRWHGQAFGSIEQMFDPEANADYAARFLSDLFAEFGDWSRAAGAYHSRTPEFAQKYRARFDRIRANLPDGLGDMRIASTPATATLAEVPVGTDTLRKNAFPLLVRRGDPISAGSLVPLDGGRGLGPLFEAG